MANYFWHFRNMNTLLEYFGARFIGSYVQCAQHRLLVPGAIQGLYRYYDFRIFGGSSFVTYNTYVCLLDIAALDKVNPRMLTKKKEKKEEKKKKKNTHQSQRLFINNGLRRPREALKSFFSL